VISTIFNGDEYYWVKLGTTLSFDQLVTSLLALTKVEAKKCKNNLAQNGIFSK
jgi:hypothetical protein